MDFLIFSLVEAQNGAKIVVEEKRLPFVFGMNVISCTMYAAWQRQPVLVRWGEEGRPAAQARLRRPNISEKHRPHQMELFFLFTFFLILFYWEHKSRVADSRAI